jgi:NAD(P)-dependent dehydrogenase (short-subunit alcohol dehydrogenase family)
VKRSSTGVAVGLGAAAAVATLYRRRPRPLRSRVAIVTGGSRGLGLAIARELVEAGCRVAICARDEAELNRAADQLSLAAGEIFPVVADVSDPDQADELVRRTVDRYGSVDLLVNNAGIIQVGPLESLTAQNFRDSMDSIFWGTLNMTLAVLPVMREHGSGQICNVTSIGGKISAPHLLPYGAAKFAAVGLSEGLRAELARHRIAVTTVVPGLMRTGSDVQAQFSGRASREYTWFALGAATPGLSMDGQRAARRIVRAVARRRTQLVLTLPAKVAVLAHGLAPGTTQGVLALVNRVLPAAPPTPDGPPEPDTSAARRAPRVVRASTALNRRAGLALNQPQPETTGTPER